ncbi:LysR family transcriptional regulator [Rhizobium sp. SSA_523]|uniref:LysR family transcriptional regulator n=1 Tax=Rhizobium sp. SSA_523 TaxID=2952477 RepID=UPI002090E20F|nr:LysR family transcriptional regulator [Rhizobium sp. SSA_523]MCO5734226.1 LysR family transcriptional regulator [Rhizobium sp. SSA_523]WKC21496.1 LysR family transcriptional regulator [Rhizobium sp. SSA_523]
MIRQKAPGLEIRHLRYFVVLVEERNFARAAARLGIAQPGLSQQIMNLETILGVSLLDRSRRAVKLTVPGQLLYEEAGKIISQMESTVSALTRVGRGESGRISVGYVASAAYAGVLLQTLSSFRKNYPEVELQLLEVEMRQQLQSLEEGRLDVGYIRPPAPLPGGIALHSILREPLVIALPAHHPQAYQAGLDLADLKSLTFITPRQPPDVGFHSNTIRACEEAGFQPSVSAVGRDFTTIVSMVALGIGVAVVPQSLRCLQLPGVRYVALSSTTTTSDLAVAHRRAETSPVVRAFLAHLRAESGAIASMSP